METGASGRHHLLQILSFSITLHYYLIFNAFCSLFRNPLYHSLLTETNSTRDSIRRVRSLGRTSMMRTRSFPTNVGSALNAITSSPWRTPSLTFKQQKILIDRLRPRIQLMSEPRCTAYYIRRHSELGQSEGSRDAEL